MSFDALLSLSEAEREVVLQEQERLAWEMYPFLDSEAVEEILELLRISNVVHREMGFLGVAQIREAFQRMTLRLIHKEKPNLHLILAKALQEVLLHESVERGRFVFKDSGAIQQAAQSLFFLPSSSEEINKMLQGLQDEPCSEIITARLAQVVLAIRTMNRELRSAETTEGDNVVAQMEWHLIQFLDTYHRRQFEDIYPWVRELIGIIPKLNIFGIDIVKLREDVEEYHESRSDDDPFFGVAEAIRESVHRRISSKAVQDIDDLIAFLHTDEPLRFVANARCAATREEKDEELSSERFQLLLDIKERLRLIWNNPFSGGRSLENTNEVDSFKRQTKHLIEQLLANDTAPLRSTERGATFLEHLEEDLQALDEDAPEKIHLGLTRYHLSDLVVDIMTGDSEHRGELAFRLLTLDTILENLSLLYYANLINIELSEIRDDNYLNAIRALLDLALCALATGQGSEDLGRFSFMLRGHFERGLLCLRKEKIG